MTTRPANASIPPAIIGLAGRFPGADDVDTLLDHLEKGADLVTERVEDRWTPARADAPQGLGQIGDVRRFDNRFFGISGAQAEAMDPQQRLLLETTWHSLEDAGVSAETLKGPRTGVFVGFMATDYHQILASDAHDTTAFDGLGGYGGILANRISHALAFGGPSLGVDAACASSLVALHLARRALLAGDCDYALVGGVSLNLDGWKSDSFQQAGMLSLRGRSRTFDISADGYVPGDGVVSLLLCRGDLARAQGHRIRAKVLGSGVNHTGGALTITHPSVEAQARLLTDVVAEAGIDASTVSYVEAHGTGTSLGDPMEVEAIRRAYCQRPRLTPLRIGSLKSNIGHLEGAAGAASVAKVVGMFDRKRLLPTIHVDQANPILPLDDGALSLVTRPTDWNRSVAEGPRRAGISSFGFGGANAHVVLEEGPDPAVPVRRKPDADALPFLLSAKSAEALTQLIADWRRFAAQPGFDAIPLRDLCGTLAVGRGTLPYRIGGLVRDHAAIRQLLDDAPNDRDATEARGWTLALDPRNRPRGWRGVGTGHGAVSRLLETLEQMTLAPSAVVGWGAMAKAAAHLSQKHGLTLIDPETGTPVGQAKPDAAHLKSLVTRLRTRTSEGAAILEKARHLLPHQRTLSRLIGDWDGALGNSGAGRAAVEAGDSRAVLIAATALRQLGRKWDLPDRVVTAFPEAAELAALVDAKVLSKADALGLLAGEGPDTLGNVTPDLMAEFGAHWPVSEPDRGRISQWASIGSAPMRDGWVAVDLARWLQGSVVTKLALDLWTRGETPDWRFLFPDGSFRAQRLPLYPFQGRKFPATRADFGTAPMAATSNVAAPVTVLSPGWTTPAPAEQAPGTVLETTLDAPPTPTGKATILLHTNTDSADLHGDLKRLHHWLTRLLTHPDLAGMSLVLATPQAAGPVWAGLLHGLGAALAQETALRQIAVVEHDAGIAPYLPAQTAKRFTHWRLTGEGAAEWHLTAQAPAQAQIRDPRDKIAVISGGAGALGLASLRALAAQGWCRFALLGRRPSVALPDVHGATITYHPCDVSDRGALSATLDTLRSEGEIGAVVHAAGATNDGLLASQDWDAFATTFTAKLDGALHLDALTRSDPLELFACHGSIVGALGNVGQAAYAAANGAAAGVITQRQADGAPGRSIVFNWSFVLGGGMGDAGTADRFAQSGMPPLNIATAEAVMQRSFATGQTGQQIVLGGPLTFDHAVIEASPVWEDTAPDAPALTQKLAALLGDSPDSLSRSAGFFELGLTSIQLQQVADDLGAEYQGLSANALFQYSSIETLAAHLATLKRKTATPAPIPNRTAAPLVLKSPAKQAASDIAIIGLSGRFPEAPDIWRFADNLLAGRDSVGPVPPGRWDTALGDGPDSARARERHGGFISDVDRFEPLFFSISPKEAELMDPQQRLSLENAWHTFENAGYGRRERLAGQPVGVFWATMWGEWSLYAAEQGYLQGEYGGPGSLYWAIPNRISYFFDLNGPSLTMDTACSSSLSAIHFACQAIRNGDCATALAGGVNLSLHPSKYDYLSEGRFLSSDGRCRSFGEGGDGYVPGEGVGSVLLKPLAAAQEDGDRIMGVIRGSAVNHGGRAVGFTAPNPAAHQALIETAMARAGVRAEDLDIVECHGTGTALGDPIEIEALAAALPDRPNGPLPIGSVKSNIGHLEAAAGVAGLAKLLMGFERGRMPGSLHGQPRNPNIPFSETGLSPLDAAMPLPRRNGHVRQAAISSFGAGGSNAHMIVAAPEYAGAQSKERSGSREILLSGRSEASLRSLIARLADWADGAPDDTPIGAVADTLRTRAEFAVRAGFVANDLADLRQKLRALPESTDLEGDTTEAHDLVNRWIAGEALDATGFRAGISLPGTPFEDERYWIPQVSTGRVPARETRTPPPATPLKQTGHLKYAIDLSADDPLLRDHDLAGRPVLAGAHGLALVRRAADMAGLPCDRFENLTWSRPVVAPARVEISFTTTGAHTGFTLGNAEGASLRGRMGSRNLPPSTLNDGIRDQTKPPTDIYRDVAAVGMNYGPHFQTIQSLNLGKDGFTAELALENAPDDDTLAPTLVDGALQAALAWIAEYHGAQAVVPVGIGNVEVHAPLPGTITARAAIRALPGGAGWHADFDLLDKGQTLVTLRGVTLRPVSLDAMIPADDTAKPTPIEWSTVTFKPNAGIAADQVASPVVFDMANASDLVAELANVGGWPVVHSDTGAPIILPLPDDDRVLCNALASLCQHLGTLNLSTGVILCYREAAPGDRITAAALGATLRTLKLERGVGDVRLLACAGNGTMPDARTMAEAIQSELALQAPTLPEIRWQGRQRFVRSEQPLLPETPGTTDYSGTWVISGGMGALGLLFAEHLARNGAGHIALLSRGAGQATDDQRAEMDRIERLGARVQPVAVDIADADAVAAALHKVRQLAGPIHGVIHSAGVTRDGMMRSKTAEDVTAVLAPKIDGALALDAATANDPLRVFALFSSIAGARGNIGQADYAFANRWLDGFAAQRAERIDRAGRSVSINWPLWQDGGMQVDAGTEARIARLLGSQSLSTQDGLKAFDIAVTVEGPAQVLPVIPVAPAAPEEPRNTAETPLDRDALLAHLRSVLAEVTKLSPDRIDSRKPVDAYGVDSVMATQMVDRLSADFSDTATGSALSPVLFFEHPTLAAVCDHLIATVPTRVAAKFAPKPTPAPAMPTTTTPVDPIVKTDPRQASDTPIAIIGLAGRFPGADDLDSFTEVLRAGRDMVDVPPADRWPNHPGTQDIRGGFLNDIAGFDPLVFGISPKDARLMDPQARLFLESTLHALENAGYADSVDGASVGVFAAAMWGHYEMEGAGTEPGPRPGSLFAEIANRVSHSFNLTGPSLAVDSMCSSSLTALHLACESLRRGECDMALAGGVNLCTRPEKYDLLGGAGFLSSEGLCRSFGEGGDGYVPGEAVGVALLKPLDQALADGDPIRAVIRGSALNHGGHARGYTVPTPGAQANVIAAAFDRAGISPDSVDYIETHGTGTSLGDPVEIAGLTRAFGTCGPKRPIGAVKSVIGHGEAAAGIASLAKVVLQFEREELFPSLHAEVLNPNIDWDSVPFVLQRGRADWTKPSGRPRRAVISGFGAGGSNAHVILEEAPEQITAPDRNGEHLFILSARTDTALAQQVTNLQAWIGTQATGGQGKEAIRRALATALSLLPEHLHDDDPLMDLGLDAGALERFCAEIADDQGAGFVPSDLAGLRNVAELLNAIAPREEPAVPLADLAWSLQVGRLPMAERLAIRASSLAELRAGLQAAQEGRAAPNVVRARIQSGVAAEAAQAEADRALEAGDLEALARAWSKGAEIAWNSLRTAPRKRLPLPLYPLERKRYWFEAETGPVSTQPLKTISTPIMTDEEARRAQDWSARALETPSDAVRIDERDGIATLTLAEPQSRNMFTDAMTLGLVRAFDRIAESDTIKVVVIKAEGPCFSMGGTPEILLDIAEGRGSFTDAPVFYRGPLECPVPVISAMRGQAYGGGMLFGLYADMPILAAESRYAAVFADYGFSPGMGATLLLPERLGEVVAAEMMYSAEPQLGSALAARGVPVRVLAGAEVETEAQRLAASLARKPRETLKQMKRQFARGLLDRLPDAIEAEVAMHAETFTLPEVREVLARRFKPDAPKAPGPMPVADSPALRRGLKPVTEMVPRGSAGSNGPGLVAITGEIADILMMEPGEVDPDRALMDQGLDSIGGVELARRLSDLSGRALDATELYDHPSPQAIATWLGGESEVAAEVPVRAKVRLRPVAARQAARAAVVVTVAKPDIAAPAPRQATTTVAQFAAAVLEMGDEPIPRDMALADLGLDSIGAVELARSLSEAFGTTVEAADLYDHPSVADLESFLGAATPTPPLAPAEPKNPAPVKTTEIETENGDTTGKIAILGMAGRFPGAGSVDAFWDTLLAGKDAVTDVPADRWDAAAFVDPDPEAPGKGISRWGGFLDGIDRFDAAFFGFSPMEAEIMDPQQRLVLETSWHALEDAGIVPSRLKGTRGGVFLGAAASDYEHLLQEAGLDTGAEAFTGLSPAILAARLGYMLDLSGPALAVETACSSSLVAVHQARRALLAGDCDFALAGGVMTMLTPRLHIKSSKAGMLSPTGRCRPFSDKADGIALSEAVGVVVLKRYDDALRNGDQIRAVIHATGTNQDGRSNGITAPSGKAQAQLLRQVLAEADMTPSRIGYVETHGTGTDLGDPIEFKALQEVFGPHQPGAAKVRIGAAKSAIGHATVAAGVTGLIAAVRALETRTAPPVVHFDAANPRLGLPASGFDIGDTTRALQHERPAALVSSFGFSGTNAMALIEPGPLAEPGALWDGDLPFILSGKDAAALQRNAQTLADWLHRNPEIALHDLAYTLATRRDLFAERVVLVAGDMEALRNGLAAVANGTDTAQPIPEFFSDAVQTYLETGVPDALGECFSRTKARFIRLPGYAFARDRHWVTPAKTTESLVEHRTQGHLQSRIRAEAPYFADHIVNGRPVLPGTATLAMAWDIATKQGKQTLSDLRWFEAVEHPETRLLHQATSDGDALQIETKTEDGAEIFTCRADTETLNGDGLDLPFLLTRMTGVTVSAEQLYNSLAARGLEHRGGFQRVAEVMLGNGEALVRLSTSPSAPLQPDPQLLDAILHGAAALLPLDADAPLYLPVSLDTVTLEGTLAACRWVHIARLRHDDGKAVFDITGSDENGRVVMSARGFTLRRVEAIRRPEPAPLQFYCPAWDPVSLPRNPVQSPLQVMVEGAAPWHLTGAIAYDKQSLAAHRGPVLLAVGGLSPYALFAFVRDVLLSAKAAQTGVITFAVASESAARAVAGMIRSFLREGGACQARVVHAEPGAKRVDLEHLACAPFDDTVLYRLEGGRVFCHRLRASEDTGEAPHLAGTWLITGGAGGLGAPVAGQIQELGGKPVLVTRSKAEVAGYPTEQADITDTAAVNAMITRVEAAHGPIRGVVHLAAHLRDRMLANLTPDDWTAVIAPKVDGLTTLLDALEGRDLQGVVAFSSMAAAQGHPGQTAYAFANGWLDGLAAERGIPIRSMAWGYWLAGGMVADPAALAKVSEESGIAPIETEAGLAALARAMGSDAPYLVAAGGDTDQIANWFSGPMVPQRVVRDASGGTDRLELRLSEELVALLKVSPDDVTPDKTFTAYGMESITLTRYSNRLNRALGINMSPATLFEADSIARLASRLAKDWPDLRDEAPVHAPIAAPAVTTTAPESPDNAPIAIIGLSAKMPGAPDLEAFWHALDDRENLITEVPASRWNWRDFAGENLPDGARTRSRWGGFIDGADLFDAGFFGISPREAELMDPQQRLYLETVWHALEDAGIAPPSLAGSKTGMFTGVATSEYFDLMLRAGTPVEAHMATGLSHSMLPNRISYLLDLRGPSEPVDTACSSSLVAMARAVEALRRGDCDLALAGGVNLLLSPTLYIAFDRAGMLSSTGRCRVFDAGANGYVRGEGLGVAVLKPLDKALADGDPIRGVIRGISVAHGGRASSLTAPNPNAQADLIERVVRQAGVDVNAIGYVEAHGTGTPLGDPVEIGGLTQAFERLGRSPDAGLCRIGSVKSNVGHLEAAAGMAGLAKVLLSFEHGRIPGQSGFEALNPHIRLEGTPFGIAVDSGDWVAPRTGTRRVAGLSSFGFGGANVHVVLEEPPERVAPSRAALPLTQFDRKRYWAQSAVVIPPVQRRASETQPDVLDGLVYRPVWQAIAAAPSASPVATPVCLVAHGPVPDTLRQALDAKFGGDLHSVDLAGPGATEQIWKHRPGTVIFADMDATPDRAKTGYDAGRSAETLLHLVQTAAKNAGSEPLCLAVLTTGATSEAAPDRPSAAALLAMARTAAREHPAWQVRAVDVRGQVEPARILDALCGTRGPVVAALDATHRYASTLVQVAGTAKSDAAFVQRGVTVILGGSGGIAQALAPLIAKRSQSAVILLGRREQDAAITATLDAIRSAGSKAGYVRADATDPDSLGRSLAEVMETWGAPDLVIDAAVSLDDVSLAGMTPERFRTVFASRAAIALAVETALLALRDGTGKAPQLLHMSSVQSFIGNEGQGNYAAACAYLDAWASGSPLDARVVNWGFWGSVGVVASPHRVAQMAAMGVGSLEPEHGMAALERVLSGEDRQLVVVKATEVAMAHLGLTRPADTTAMQDGLAALEAALPQIVAGLLDTVAAEAVTHRQERLYSALNAMVQGTNASRQNVEQALDDLEQTYPGIAAHIGLSRLALTGLPQVLTGTQDGVSVLMPNGDPRFVEAIYSGNPMTDAANLAAAEQVAQALPIGGTVLEVGAGTGGTSGAVLERLRTSDPSARYIYSDMSEAFLRVGQTKFGQMLQRMEFRLFDATMDVAAQGIEPHSVDVILAANVLHATPDVVATLATLRQALKPGGTLVLVELTQRFNVNTLTFGLLPGWWTATDPERRLPHAPLLDAAGWRAALTEAGFEAPEATEAAPGLSTIRARAGQTAAAAPATAKRSKPSIALISSREATPEPANDARPQTVTAITALLAEVLRTPQAEIDTRAEFQTLGVDSILAAEVAGKLSDRFGIPIKPTELYNHPNAERLARHIDAGRPASAAPDTELDREAEADAPVPDEDAALLDLLERLERGEIGLEEAQRALEVSHG